MSKKKGPAHGGTKARAKRAIAAPKGVKSTPKWLMIAVAGIAVVGALVAFSVVSQPRQPAILTQKCSGRCHSVSKLTGLNLDAASAEAAVDKMVRARKVTLTPPERAAVVSALSRR